MYFTLVSSGADDGLGQQTPAHFLESLGLIAPVFC
jgi:hypothetical protein